MVALAMDVFYWVEPRLVQNFVLSEPDPANGV